MSPIFRKRRRKFAVLSRPRPGSGRLLRMIDKFFVSSQASLNDQSVGYLMSAEAVRDHHDSSGICWRTPQAICASGGGSYSG
jgi:hypothetical protein